jgi:HK97 family phage major capsid protein
MAVAISEARFALLEARSAYRELLDREAGGETLSSAARAQREKLSRDVPRLEAELTRLEGERDAEIGEFVSGRRASRIDGKFYKAAVTDDAHEVAAVALPPLPSRSRAALARLYPAASNDHDPEAHAEAWRGVVAAALGGAPMHPAVMAATATEGVPGEGGFAVTPEVAAGIFASALEGSVWARIGARVETMTSDEKVINAVDDSDETDDEEAGLKAQWKGEASEADIQLMKLRRCVLKTKKLIVLAAASNELGEDAPDYVVALEAAVARAIGKKFDRAVLSGNGAAQPLGLLNSPATIEVAKETGQAADTFVWENATKMWSRLAPGSHENAWWLIHPTVLPEGLSMSMVIGTAGTQPRGAFESGGPTGYRLLGRPVVVTSRVKVLGDKGDVILADPSQIAIGIRRGFVIERSMHAFFSSDRLAVRGKFRGDAKPIWAEPRTLVDSGGTVSPVVVLAAR